MQLNHFKLESVRPLVAVLIRNSVPKLTIVGIPVNSVSKTRGTHKKLKMLVHRTESYNLGLCERIVR